MKRCLFALAMLCIGALASVPALAHDTVYYYYTDTLHNAVAVTDASGNVLERTYCAPYGQVLNRSMRNGPGYTGHEEDPATGLVYMQQRYYDPQSGRFLSTDPVLPTAEGGNFNRYWYAKDSPYRYTDPDGRDITEALGGLFYETASFITGGGFHGSSILGALEDGYNGQGSGVRGALEQDAGTVLIVVSGGTDAPEVVGAEEAVEAASDAGAEAAEGAGTAAAGRGGETAAAEVGRLAHKQFADRVKQKAGWQSEPQNLVDPATGQKVVPDAVTPSGHPIELKPNTPSGRRAGARQIKRYERATGKSGRVIYYEPNKIH